MKFVTASMILFSFAASANPVNCYKKAMAEIKTELYAPDSLFSSLCAGAKDNSPVECFKQAIKEAQTGSLHREYVALKLCAASPINFKK